MKKVLFFVIVLSFAPAWSCGRLDNGISNQDENSNNNTAYANNIPGRVMIQPDST